MHNVQKTDEKLAYAPDIFYYDRVRLDRLSWIGAETGDHDGAYAYVAVDEKANHLQIGLCQISSRGMQITHQLLETVNYLHAMEIAHEIARGNYRLHDGKLTRRFFHTAQESPDYSGPRVEVDGIAYIKANPGMSLRPSINRLEVRLPKNGEVALMVRKAHRAVFGDPRQGAAIINMDDVDLVVRYDRHLDRITMGLSPADNDGSKCEFVEFFRMSYQTAGHAIERWPETVEKGEGISFSAAAYIPNMQFSGEKLMKLVEAVRTVRDQTWPSGLVGSQKKRERTIDMINRKREEAIQEDIRNVQEADKQPGVVLPHILRDLISFDPRAELTFGS